MNQNDTRPFTGVFIPAHIWESTQLSPLEKMLLAEIEALSKHTGWCKAGREHFATWMRCTPQNVTYFTRNLERMGFLEVERRAGYGSKMRVVASKFYTQSEPEHAEEVVKPVYGGSKAGLRGVVKPVDGGGKAGLPEIQYKYNKKNKERESAREKFSKEEIEAAIAGYEEAVNPKKNMAASPGGAAAETRIAEDDPDPIKTAMERAISFYRENPETVKWWYDTAMVQQPARLADFQRQVAAFYSHWMGLEEYAGHVRAKPLQFFKVRFINWIQNKKNQKPDPVPTVAADATGNGVQIVRRKQGAGYMNDYVYDNK